MERNRSLIGETQTTCRHSSLLDDGMPIGMNYLDFTLIDFPADECRVSWTLSQMQSWRHSSSVESMNERAQSSSSLLLRSVEDSEWRPVDHCGWPEQWSAATIWTTHSSSEVKRMKSGGAGDDRLLCWMERCLQTPALQIPLNTHAPSPSPNRR